MASMATQGIADESPGGSATVAAHRDDVVRDLPAPENRLFYPALDGLRGLAVVMVFCGH